MLIGKPVGAQCFLKTIQERDPALPEKCRTVLLFLDYIPPFLCSDILSHWHFVDFRYIVGIISRV